MRFSNFNFSLVRSFIEYLFSHLSLVIVFFLLAIVVFRLSQLQVKDGREYLIKAQENTYATKVVLPRRGKIITSDGREIAGSERKYRAYASLSNISATRLAELTSKIDKVEGVEYELDETNHLLKINDLSPESFANLREDMRTFPELLFVVDEIRKYQESNIFSPITGYIGEPDEEDVNDRSIDPQVKVGKTGVEFFYDNFLRGEVGKEIIERKIDGEFANATLMEEVNGSDILLTIDYRWQGKLYELLNQSVEKGEALSSAGVIMDVATGEIKALVSAPSYDANLFVSGISMDDYQRLTDDISEPMQNKAIGGAYVPGSVFKPTVVLSVLDEGIVSKDYTYTSRGCETLDDAIRFCEADGRALGDLDLSLALGRSSNLYFCNLGRQYIEEYGNLNSLQYFLDYLDRTPFGKTTGVDLTGEVKGTLPDLERLLNSQNRTWSLGDMCNAFIGQGDITVTPLQMSVFTGSLFNDGEIVKPHVVKRVVTEDGEMIMDNVAEETSDMRVSSEDVEVIKKGLQLTKTDRLGTARAITSAPGNIYIKTGSAEVVHNVKGQVIEGAHSWVTGSFEYDGKVYSYALVQMFGGRGYRTVPAIGNFVECLHSDFAELCEIYK